MQLEEALKNSDTAPVVRTERKFFSTISPRNALGKM